MDSHRGSRDVVSNSGRREDPPGPHTRRPLAECLGKTPCVVGMGQRVHSKDFKNEVVFCKGNLGALAYPSFNAFSFDSARNVPLNNPIGDVFACGKENGLARENKKIGFQESNGHGINDCAEDGGTKNVTGRNKLMASRAENECLGDDSIVSETVVHSWGKIKVTYMQGNSKVNDRTVGHKEAYGSKEMGNPTPIAGHNQQAAKRNHNAHVQQFANHEQKPQGTNLKRSNAKKWKGDELYHRSVQERSCQKHRGVTFLQQGSDNYGYSETLPSYHDYQLNSNSESIGYNPPMCNARHGLHSARTYGEQENRYCNLLSKSPLGKVTVDHGMVSDGNLASACPKHSHSMELAMALELAVPRHSSSSSTVSVASSSEIQSDFTTSTDYGFI